MYCTNCGTVINGRFCSSCGAPAYTEQSNHQPNAIQNIANSQLQPNMTVEKKGTLKCSRCGCYDINVQAVNETKRRGCFAVVLYIFLAITLIGLFVLIPLLRGRKSETITYAICQNCGNKWRLG